jgi:PIN domain nuclease of toxin-antitoxin system
MITDRKNVVDWETILIDTGVLLALFHAQNGSTDPTIVFIKKLITHLCKMQAGKYVDRKIYISTITVGEVLTKESGQDKINRILKILDSNNVEFLSFDIETSLQFNIRMQPYLEKEAIHKKAAELGFITKDFGMARQWISKDYNSYDWIG